jgi:hypothetical protein
MLRRIVAVTVVVPMFGVAWLLSSPSPAAAVTSHRVAGTYQLDIQNFGSQTLVLLPNGTVGPPGSGTWTVQKPRHTVHTVVIDLQGGQAPAVDCVRAGQPPFCYYHSVLSGPKTPSGIASQAAPGTANAYIGSSLLESEPFWAVRTGKA